MNAAGFEIETEEGVVVPVPFVFGNSRLSRILLAINQFLVKVRPTLFGFQLLVTCKARPTLETLLHDATTSASEKLEMPVTIDVGRAPVQKQKRISAAS